MRYVADYSSLPSTAAASMRLHLSHNLPVAKMTSLPGSGSVRDLTQSSLAALKWNYAGVAVKVLAQCVVSVVLARLLGPEPFGVYSAVLLVTGVGSVIVERGFGSALIQTRDLNQEVIRYAFTRLLLAGVGAATVLCAAAPSVAALFRYPAFLALTGNSVSPHC